MTLRTIVYQGTKLTELVLMANGVMIDQTVGLSKFARRLAPCIFGIISLTYLDLIDKILYLTADDIIYLILNL